MNQSAAPHATPWFVTRCSDPLSYDGMSGCPPPTRRERERRPNGGSRVILRSRATIRRPTTGHLVDASTSSTACTSSAAFLPGPSLVKKRLLTARCFQGAKHPKTKTPHLALGAGGAITSLPDPERFVVLYGVRLPASGPAPILPDANRSPSSTLLEASIAIATDGMSRYPRAYRSLLFAPRSNSGANRLLNPHTTLPGIPFGTPRRAAPWRVPDGDVAER